MECKVWSPAKPLKHLHPVITKNHHTVFAMIYASAFYLNLPLVNFGIKISNRKVNALKIFESSLPLLYLLPFDFHKISKSLEIPNRNRRMVSMTIHATSRSPPGMANAIAMFLTAGAKVTRTM